MKLFRALLFTSLILFISIIGRAQEGEAQELDSVIARVNTEIILKSAYTRELQGVIDDMKQRGLKDEELEKKLAEIKPGILDSLIDQQLLAQRAKELSIDVEAQVNEQLVRMMKENNIASIEELEQKMREVGIDLNDHKRTLRYKFLSDAVMGREVYGPIYQKLTEGTKREFYEKHQDWFSTPGEVELSIIFIQKGKNPLLQQQSLTKAKEIGDQARGGADFAALARSKSEDNGTAKTGGKIGTLKIPDLSPEIRVAVEKAPAGTITEPVPINNGYAVYRIDARKEPVVMPFEKDEVKNAVSQRLAMEKGEDSVKEYLAHLREDSFIEIDQRYQMPGLKTSSANIKRTPFSEETEKEKKRRQKREKKEKEQQQKDKETAKPKETAQK